MSSEIIFQPMDRPRLYGRKALLERLALEFKDGRTLYGFEGVGGAGKTELANRFVETMANDAGYHVVPLDARELASESLMIAALYVGLREIPRTTEQQIEHVGRAIRERTIGLAKRVIGAAIQDLIKYATDKAENVARVIKEEIKGETGATSVEGALDELNSANQRMFIGQYMSLVGDIGNPVIVKVDNYEASEPTVQSFLRFLLHSLPTGWRLVVVNNTESLPQADWGTVMAPSLEYNGGVVEEVRALDECTVAEWYCEAIGTEPSGRQVKKLIDASNGGRAAQLSQFIDVLRSGGTVGPRANYDRFQRARRLERSAAARTVASLAALAPAEALLPLELLESAAIHAGVPAPGAAVDELCAAGDAEIIQGALRFRHSSYHGTWRRSLSQAQIQTLAGAWYSVYREIKPEVKLLASTGLVPALTPQILSQEGSDSVTDLAQKLVAEGAQNDALVLLDASWRISEGEVRREDMIEHALIAAQTRLDLGRYQEAHEALRTAEVGATDQRQLITADLIRLKLALRQNSYPAVWSLSEKLRREAGEDLSLQLEREMVVNTAMRDLMALEELRGSIKRLEEYSTHLQGPILGGVQRSLARSLAKLDRGVEAIDVAREAIRSAETIGDVRAIGNAQLALGEALRYAGHPAQARESYRLGRQLAQGAGNRDGWIWCLLGEAVSHLQEGNLPSARTVVADAGRLVDEPGYQHPLERAHVQMVVAIADLLEGCPSDLEGVDRAYTALGVDWPKTYLERVAETRTLEKAVPI